ncbi:MAG TPA: response regulator [Planctomycetota bacterium]|nr:response regulator [Planctomycetota bacterium]HRR82301.1 response regulator [Planctomycetota bacterium]HRT95159.1 response regulator [Planctomycetota bacterium]
MVVDEERAAHPEARRSVLIAEQEERLRRDLGSLFDAEGYETYLAGDDAAAFEIVHHRRIDVVLVQLEIPHRGGLALLRAIRARSGAAVPCVLTAREVSGRVQVSAFLEDAFAVVPKPLDDALLRRVVASALRPRRRV